jgi:preprotein translocase subunit SecA
MDYLKDGIGLRAMAQRDPLIEYQREGYSMFQTMMAMIREEAVGFIFNLDVQVVPAGGVAQVEVSGLEQNEQQPQKLSYSAPDEDGGVSVSQQSGPVITDDERQRLRQQGSPKPPTQPSKKGAFGQSLD